jgi:hypothetical protein
MAKSLIIMLPKGGVETTGFLRTLTVFRCVSLTDGCVSSSFVYAGCVSVLLHFSLHVFFIVVFIAILLHGLACVLLHDVTFLRHSVQVVLMEENPTTLN